MSFSAAPTESFDVIVVGGGHAGCEAAITAARLGLSTALFTLNLDRIAWQPCNPAVGGPAKSQLVHEVAPAKTSLVLATALHPWASPVAATSLGAIRSSTANNHRTPSSRA